MSQRNPEERMRYKRLVKYGSEAMLWSSIIPESDVECALSPRRSSDENTLQCRGRNLNSRMILRLEDASPPFPSLTI